MVQVGLPVSDVPRSAPPEVQPQRSTMDETAAAR